MDMEPRFIPGNNIINILTVMKYYLIYNLTHLRSIIDINYLL